MYNIIQSGLLYFERLTDRLIDRSSNSEFYLFTTHQWCVDLETKFLASRRLEDKKKPSAKSFGLVNFNFFAMSYYLLFWQQLTNYIESNNNYLIMVAIEWHTLSHLIIQYILWRKLLSLSGINTLKHWYCMKSLKMCCLHHWNRLS